MTELLVPIVNLVGLAAVSIWIIRFVMRHVWKFVEKQQTVIENHLSHNTAALTELTSAIRELRDVLRQHTQ